MTTEKFALVTGAGSGIGKSVALALAADGYHVALAGRRKAALEATAQAGEHYGRRLLVLPADITRADEVDALFGAVQREFGRLDVLFNNAGIFARSVSLEDLTPDEWQAAVDVNITGAFLCTRAAFRLMKDQ